MGQITANRAMRLILLLSIFFIVTHAKLLRNYVSINDVLDESETSTRHPVHTATHILRAFIQEEGQPILQLRWSTTGQVVANQNLPVWGAQPGHIESKNKDADKILKQFVMYQDLEHESAIVYVDGKEMFYGNVGTKYYIHDLPLKVVLKKRILKVGGPYVKKNPRLKANKVKISIPSVEINSVNNTTHHKDKKQVDPVKASINRTPRDSSHEVRMKVKAHNGRQIFFVESLLFVTYDVVEPIKSEHPTDYLFHILLHYAVQFNSIDMLFGKLPTKFRIHVNLAGIIFEENADVFSSVIKSPILDYSQRNKSLKLKGFARLFSSYYLDDPDFVLPKNSFDHVFISTGRELEFEVMAVQGQSFGGIDLYKMRQTRRHPMVGIPKSIVRNSDPFTSFVVGAHEIGNVFAYANPDEEPCIEESQEQLVRADDLKWDRYVVCRIEIFMRKNRNRCWLLNYPRSLYPENIPVAGQYPSEQCECYEYSIYGKNHDTVKRHVPPHACARPLKCSKLENQVNITERTLVPFDGTPCHKDGEKVCWQQKCVAVGVPYQQKSRS